MSRERERERADKNINRQRGREGNLHIISILDVYQERHIRRSRGAIPSRVAAINNCSSSNTIGPRLIIAAIVGQKRRRVASGSRVENMEATGKASR